MRNLAARAAMMAKSGGAGGYDVQDYVGWGTSDLIAMWDGIRNVGATAAHDSTSTTWACLNNSTYNLSTTATYCGSSWDSDSLVADGTNVMAGSLSQTMIPVDDTYSYAVEAVFSVDSALSWSSQWGLSIARMGWKSISGSYKMANWLFFQSYPSLGRKLLVLSFPRNKSYNCSVSNISAGKHTIYVQGLNRPYLDTIEQQGDLLFDQDSFGSLGSGLAFRMYVGGYYGPNGAIQDRNSIPPAGFRLYSIRFYRRALTTAEQTLNHAIDCARFGIT